jgi:hypothetical protein
MAPHRLPQVGEKYHGALDAAGRRHDPGRAELFLANGDVYVGGFVRGKRSGSGNYFSRRTGDLFQGQWLNDSREGPGTLYYGKSGKILKGQWVNDICVAGEYIHDSVPVIGLKDSREILNQAEMLILDDRKLYRAKYLPIESLLPEDILTKAVAMFEANISAFSAKQAASKQATLQGILDTLEIDAIISDADCPVSLIGNVNLEICLRVVAFYYVKSR